MPSFPISYVKAAHRGNMLRLFACIAVCLIAGFVGSLYTTQAIPSWYAGLHKPSFNPPNWVFGPVWTILYILMGMGLFLVWREDWTLKTTKVAVSLFAAQLALNVGWSIVFFGFRQIQSALAVIILLWMMIGATILAFDRTSKTAGALLVPYLAWVTFAALLNYSVMQLNI
jgi:translocator protein